MIDREALLNELRRLSDGNTPPTVTDIKEQGEYSLSAYQNRFGSWSEACREAGFSPRDNGRKITKDDLLSELRRLADGDVPPTAAEMNEAGAYSAMTYHNRFGSWNDAVAEAGLKPQPSIVEEYGRIPVEALLAELRRLADGDIPPTQREMDETGAYSAKTYQNRFGSWREACAEAGFTPRDPH